MCNPIHWHCCSVNCYIPFFWGECHLPCEENDGQQMRLFFAELRSAKVKISSSFYVTH